MHFPNAAYLMQSQKVKRFAQNEPDIFTHYLNFREDKWVISYCQ